MNRYSVTRGRDPMEEGIVPLNELPCRYLYCIIIISIILFFVFHYYYQLFTLIIIIIIINLE